MQLTAHSHARSWQAQITSFVFDLIGTQAQPIAMAFKKARDERHLKELPDYLLDDVGLQRRQIEPAVETGRVSPQA